MPPQAHAAVVNPAAHAAVSGTHASTPLSSPPVPPRVHPGHRFLHTFIALGVTFAAFALFVAETLASFKGFQGLWLGETLP